jgi:hypothetical protein
MVQNIYKLMVVIIWVKGNIFTKRRSDMLHLEEIYLILRDKTLLLELKEQINDCHISYLSMINDQLILIDDALKECNVDSLTMSKG